MMARPLGGEVAWWCPSLDDTSNGTTTLDDLIGSSNGTLTNMDAATDWVSDTANGGVRALDFDGINDRVICPINLNLLPTVHLSAWVYATRTTDFAIIGNDNGSFGRVVRSVNSRFEVLNTQSTSSLSNIVNVPVNTWFHVAVLWSTTTMTLHLNGVLVASAAGESPTYNDATVTHLGQTGPGGAGQSLRGRLDDIRIFNRALTQTEITALASQRGYQSSNWTPSQITTKAWYDAADTSTIFNAASGGSLPANGQAVGRWNDKSGNSRHVSQANGASQPQRRTTVQNGLDGIRFDGLNDFLQDNGASSYWTFLHDGQSSCFIVAKLLLANPDTVSSLFGTYETTWSGAGLAIYHEDRSSTGRNNGFVASVGNASNLGGVASATALDGWPTQQANLGTVLCDTLNTTVPERIKLQANAGEVKTPISATQNASSVNPLFSLKVGGLWNSQWFLNGDIYEIIIIEGLVDDLTKNRIEGYLAWKWGIQSLLPNDHPYKTYAPTLTTGSRRRRQPRGFGL